MFYHLEGTITDLSLDRITVDCFGMGFEVLTTPNTISQLKIGNKSKLYISESIGEDHHDLYGFCSLNEKKLFELLTTVSGIGPKAALSILSCNNPDTITNAIANNNESVFTSCPGIGKKTAQRVILELKDKIAKSFNVSIEDYNVPNIEKNDEYDIAIKGLLSLGYNSSEINAAIKQIDINGMNSEQIIRNVLRYML